MFGSKVGDSVLKTDIGDASQFFCSVTRDSRKGTIYIKVVNTAKAARMATVNLNGVASVDGEAKAMTLAASNLQATNTITSPTAVVPVESVVKGIGKTFLYTFPAYSVTVLEVRGAVGYCLTLARPIPGPLPCSPQGREGTRSSLSGKGSGE